MEEHNRDALLQAIDELPLPNRDTLAFLCSHWQNVAANSNKNQMPITNIAICFGPTISSSKTGSFQSSAMNVDQQLEYKRQQDILLSLLELDHVSGVMFAEFGFELIAVLCCFSSSSTLSLCAIFYLHISRKI